MRYEGEILVTSLIGQSLEEISYLFTMRSKGLMRFGWLWLLLSMATAAHAVVPHAHEAYHCETYHEHLPGWFSAAHPTSCLDSQAGRHHHKNDPCEQVHSCTEHEPLIHSEAGVDFTPQATLTFPAPFRISLPPKVIPIDPVAHPVNTPLGSLSRRGPPANFSC